MKRILVRAVRALALVCMLQVSTPGHAADGAVVTHDITVDVKRERGEVRVKDRLALPAGVSGFVLTSRAQDIEWDPTVIQERPPSRALRRFTLASGVTGAVEIAYTLPLGPLTSSGTGAGADGIVWDGSAPWYPVAPARLHAFTLTATAPDQWRVVSQGARLSNETVNGRRGTIWRETQPQEEIYLIAAPFTEYTRRADGLELMAFLRRPDRELAERYLELTARYIGMYEDLIGKYPYAKFALVENTWESGYGMPSFTLLGPRVIRLPFIPYTSYPHEILHNWWGNSVYVVPNSGNWSEGLTSYLADHFLKEQRGEGAEYRRDALQKYLDFVSTEKDFPLTEFRARHDEATQAVGYSKSLMLFHMLRRRLGDAVFFSALRRFYRDFQFKRASFFDLQRTFEKASGGQLGWFFDQWVRRAGAPTLALSNVTLVHRDSVFSVKGRLRQTQPGPVYDLNVPVRISEKNGSSRHRLELHARQLDFELALDSKPLSMTVDPDFDVFRKLAVSEVPPSLGAAYGASRLTFVVPRDATDAQRAAYEAFIAPWRTPDRETASINDEAPLPDSGAVWLLGWDNRRRPQVARPLAPLSVTFHGDSVSLSHERLARREATVVLAARTGDGRPLLWTHLADSDSSATARRLRHYGRVSYVAFKNGEPVSSGQWPVLDSPLTVRFE